MKRHIKDTITSRALQHVLFWLFSWFVFANTFKVSANLQKIDFIYSALFHISLLESVYLNLWVLIPKYLYKKRYIYYILGISLIIIVGIQLNMFTFNYLTDRILTKYYFISYYNYLDLLKIFIVYLALTALLKLSKSWFKMQELNNRLLLIQQEHVKSELKALKSQINPHFLFNSLNLIYSLAIKNSEITPDAVIKLSDILRYVTYDTKKEKITLRQELGLINNYLDLQRLRIDKDVRIEFNTTLDNPQCEFPPMLLLPLIENSFKHGIGGRTQHPYVTIDLVQDKTGICFKIENNIPDQGKENINGDEGIGLENIRKRLALLYPERHKFELVEDENKFIVTLAVYETN